jgi:hypothetical protein
MKVECCCDERFVKARRVNAKNFFAELKRRNVYKVAIAYGVVAWLLMQVASQIFPFFEIPNWAVRLVVLLLIIGFPVAVILAWAFELTPEGIKRAEDVDLSKSLTRKSGRKLATERQRIGNRSESRLSLRGRIFGVWQCSAPFQPSPR